ncbi:MAG: sigma-70 family RNA polymerase sigma factor [Desulfatitalea sp.]
MDTTEENRLISAILDGDAEAFAVLVRRYQRPIYNMMLRMTGSREDATDLTQEAFLKVYANLERFRPSGRFFPWIYAIGINLARDHLRKRKSAADATRLHQQGCAADTLQGDGIKHLCYQLDASRLPLLLSQLQEEYREALILRFHEGLAMRDVGLALGISTSGAKMRVQRGLQRLRDMLHLEESPGSTEMS